MFLYKKILTLILAATVLVTPISAYAAEADEATQTVTLSKDNSLKSITLSSGTLSPEFSPSTVNYTTTVGYGVTDIVVDAALSNSSATINSISGNSNLQVGENTIKITVTSEAGTVAVYTITATRLSEAESEGTGETETTETGEEEENTNDGETTYEKELAVINEDGTVTIGDKHYDVKENNYISEPQGQVYSEQAYDELEDKYNSLKKMMRIGLIIAVVVIVLLVILFIVACARRRGLPEEEPVFDYDEDDENDEEDDGYHPVAHDDIERYDDIEEDEDEDFASEDYASVSHAAVNHKTADPDVHSDHEEKKVAAEPEKTDEDLSVLAMKAHEKLKKGRIFDTSDIGEEMKRAEELMESNKIENTKNTIDIMDLNDL